MRVSNTIPTNALVRPYFRDGVHHVSDTAQDLLPAFLGVDSYETPSRNWFDPYGHAYAHANSEIVDKADADMSRLLGGGQRSGTHDLRVAALNNVALASEALRNHLDKKAKICDIVHEYKHAGERTGIAAGAGTAVGVFAGHVIAFGPVGLVTGGIHALHAGHTVHTANEAVNLTTRVGARQALDARTAFLSREASTRGTAVHEFANTAAIARDERHGSEGANLRDHWDESARDHVEKVFQQVDTDVQHFGESLSCVQRGTRDWGREYQRAGIDDVSAKAFFSRLAETSAGSAIHP